MGLLKFFVGIVLGVIAGGLVKTITSGGGIIVGRDNIQNAIDREENNVRGRFSDLKVTDSDPKFYK